MQVELPFAAPLAYLGAVLSVSSGLALFASRLGTR